MRLRQHIEVIVANAGLALDKARCGYNPFSQMEVFTITDGERRGRFTFYDLELLQNDEERLCSIANDRFRSAHQRLLEDQNG